jgi:hypothetical protein
MNASGEYLFFLNADTEVKSDFLEEFEKTFSEKKFGAAGLKLYYPDGKFQPSCYLENNFINEIRNKNLERSFREFNELKKSKVEKNYQSLKKVDWVSGAAMIIKRNVFDEIGGFDERFFLFYEDADICKRLTNSGYDVYFYPYSKIVHLKGENVNTEFNDITYYFSKKSQLLYYKIHKGIFQRILIRTYLLIKYSILRLINPSRMNILVFKLLLGKNK